MCHVSVDRGGLACSPSVEGMPPGQPKGRCTAAIAAIHMWRTATADKAHQPSLRLTRGGERIGDRKSPIRHTNSGGGCFCHSLGDQKTWLQPPNLAPTSSRPYPLYPGGLERATYCGLVGRGRPLKCRSISFRMPPPYRAQLAAALQCTRVKA